MTLEQYLRQEFEEGKIDHVLRAHVVKLWPEDPGTVEFYVHPMNRNGSTTPLMIVIGNDVRPKFQ
jgi:hypothetical protein